MLYQKILYQKNVVSKKYRIRKIPYQKNKDPVLILNLISIFSG